MTTLEEGIDISNWQGGDFNWDQAKREGKTFALIKVGENFIADQDYQLNWDHAGNAGFKRGGYYYVHPSNDPVAEARWFMHNLNGAWRIAGDFERTDGFNPSGFTSRAFQFLSTCYNQLRDRGDALVPVDFYSYKSFIASNVVPGQGLEKYFGLWLASPDRPFTTTPWDKYDILQYGQRTVSGMSVDVDEWINTEGLVDVTNQMQVTDFAEWPDGTVYKLRADGSVNAYNRNGIAATFNIYTIKSDDGHFYTFAPDANGGVFAYPGLPDADKQDSRGIGVRRFYEIRSGGPWEA